MKKLWFKKKSYVNVGLVGTKPTMEENYLISRLELHGIKTIVPDSVKDRIKIYDIICNELSYNIFKDDSRKCIVNIIKKLITYENMDGMKIEMHN